MGNVIHLSETESTNQYLSALLRKEKLEEGTIVMADFQTAGKGLANNCWESEAGKNLTISLVLYPGIIEAHDQFIISQLVSLAIIDTLKTKVENSSIKWPNDIYVGDKKIAGILIENVLNGKQIESCLIGIGINVNQELFISDAPNPVSLKQLTQKTFHLNLLLEEIKTNIFSRYMQALNDDATTIIREYLTNLYRIAGFHKYLSQGTVFDAKILTVRPSGHIILENKEGERKSFGYKEVEFII